MTRSTGSSPMRISAGSRKGATIYAPKGLETRPTSDRVREAAFNLIGPVDDAIVLDLFAGSGAYGLEAPSRAAEVTVGRRYDLMLVDPPYKMFSSLQKTMVRYLAGVLAPDGLLVVETSAKEEPELPLAVRTSRRYGSARLTLFEHV